MYLFPKNFKICVILSENLIIFYFTKCFKYFSLTCIFKSYLSIYLNSWLATKKTRKKTIEKIIYFTHSLRVFPTSICWWSFTGVWLTASLQDSSQYSDRYQQCCSLNGLNSSTDYQGFGDHSKRTIYDYYHRYLHVPQLYDEKREQEGNGDNDI